MEVELHAATSWAASSEAKLPAVAMDAPGVEAVLLGMGLVRSYCYLLFWPNLTYTSSRIA